MVVLALGVPEGIASVILIACAVWLLVYLTRRRPSSTSGRTHGPRVRATVPVRNGLCNPFGMVHGGIYGSIAESIATAATIYRVHTNGSCTPVNTARQARTVRRGDSARITPTGNFTAARKHYG